MQTFGSRSFRCPLSFQTTLPDDFERNDPFARLIDGLAELGFWGVELNIADPTMHDFEAVRAWLRERGLEFSMLATGLTARRKSLSLSHADEVVRRMSVEHTQAMIGWLQGSATGLIVGLLKGGVSATAAEARQRLRWSLEEIFPVAAEQRVSVLVEATNRYETSVANSVAEAGEFVAGYPVQQAKVLPDTFHMNIEETDALAALRENLARIPSIHLSDNNRRFPGLGAIDFKRFIEALAALGYGGRLAIEGNARGGDMIGDLRASMRYLGPLLEAEAASRGEPTHVL
jgi:Sugar phosphate isomerases/epimerases